MGKKILIVTSSIDLTVTYIIDKYSSIADFYRFNVDQLAEYKVSVGREYWSIVNDCWGSISSDSTDAIYYRKPRLPVINEYEEFYHGLIRKDIISLINGIVDAFDGIVLTKPYILRRAENKVTQLLLSNIDNLVMPSSFIGNSIENDLLNIREKNIIKPLSTGKVSFGGKTELFQTNIFDADLVSGEMRDISTTPLYLQNYVNKKYEARVTIIADTIFCVRIDSINKIDWRTDYKNINYSLIDCPKYIVKQCYAIMKELEISFGAFDYIVNEKNEWIFLEVNPNGQWLWLEEELGINISLEIVRYLLGEGNNK